MLNNKLVISKIALYGLPFLLQACVFGENKQFFDKSDGGAVSSTSSSIPSLTAVGNTTTGGIIPAATPDRGEVIGPVPGATPVASATPIASATPVVITVPAPTATPVVVSTPAPTATPCTTAATTTENLRIMFMVDNSGSTASTDPAHNYRVKTVRSFINSYGSHANLTYSFGYFSGTTSKEYDGSRGNFQATPVTGFGDASFLSSALTSYNSLAPSGNTPYAAAFASLKAMIQKDVASGVKQKYVVVFMSDGMPTDISGNVTTGIIQMISGLRSAVQANGTSLLTVSSVYFGPESDHGSIGNLQTVASEGQGQFVDTNLLNSALQINDVITVPGTCSSH